VSEQKTPVLFFAHGSPMNAIQDNSFTRTLKTIGSGLPKPKGILCISAHWMTKGQTAVTEAPHPKTIHDFYGFPEKLYQCQYPAPGSPELAHLIQQQIKDPMVIGDQGQWGFDHGLWSVMLHTHPRAEIPVIQISMDMTKPASHHFEMGRKLGFLRRQGYMIIGSGNIVHNLRHVYEEGAPIVDWAQDFDEWVKECLLQRDFKPLYEDYLTAPGGAMSVPTPDHYYPFLYTLGACEDDDKITFDFEGFQNGSLSMRTVRFS
jgi:4,5-DOPA dioxygenase extradiol